MSATVVYMICVAGYGCGSRDSVKDTEVGVCLMQLFTWSLSLGVGVGTACVCGGC